MKKTLVRSFAVAVSMTILAPAYSQAAIATSLQALSQNLASGDAAAVLGGAFDNSSGSGSAELASKTLTLPSPKPVSQSQQQQAMLQNLDVIQSAFQSQYGPGLYKEAHEGWDLDKQIALAKQAVQSTPNMTLDQYHDVLRKFFGSMKDFHVSVQFDSTEASSLPFMVQGSGGHYYIEWIDRSKLPEDKFPFHVGDELVSFGGKSTAQVIKGLEAKLGGNTALTEQALASEMLTSRSGASYGDVAKGPISIAVKPQGSDQVVTTQLTWNYKPEQIQEPEFSAENLTVAGNTPKVPMPFVGNMLSPVKTAMDGPNAASPFGIGDRDGFVPALGKQTWQSDKDAVFNAYIYQTPDGRSIGYVRIPEYEVDGDDYDGAVKEFGELMKRFQASADGLVIDQVDNPGGAVFYVYALASMLTDQPLSAPKHHVAITQDDVAQALKFLKVKDLVKTDEQAQQVLGKTSAGYPVDMQFFQNMVDYSQFIVDQWNQGKTLTDATHLDGVDQIQPSKVAQFTKPILLLINELDFSGGDFFPAIMQDNKRATLFGTRTAGAGGFVRDVQFPNQMGISGFSMTGSIAERADHQPIENLGVHADVQYQPDAVDMQGGFQDYVKAVNAAMSKLLGAPVAGK